MNNDKYIDESSELDLSGCFGWLLFLLIIIIASVAGIVYLFTHQ